MKRVYFIKPIGMDGPVKIGSSVSPDGRRITLQSWSPFPLEIIAEIEGDTVLEARFHRHFIETYERGEWFTWSEEMARVVDAINGGAFDTATLPPYAGKISALKPTSPDYSEMDLEYMSALRAYYRRDYCRVPPYQGNMPELNAFVRTKSQERKRETLTNFKAYLAAQGAPA